MPKAIKTYALLCLFAALPAHAFALTPWDAKNPLADECRNTLSCESPDLLKLDVADAYCTEGDRLVLVSGKGNEDLFLVETITDEDAALEAAFNPSALFKMTDKAMEEVEKHVAYFTGASRTRFATYLERSGRYLEMMRGTFRSYGLPEDLVFLSLIESGFNPLAYSSARASGPWQFMEATGKLYGLKVDWWVDERRDPVKSTNAAARHLKDLYDRFGSWSLAMAAYNAGTGRVSSALRRAKADDFWDLAWSRHLRLETRAYVPKFIAARMIAQNPGAYGFDSVNYQTPLEFDEVKISGPVDLNIIATSAGATYEKIKELNPELRRWCTPPNVKEYTLRIPKGTYDTFVHNFAQVPNSKKFSVVAYWVKPGDSLWKISRSTGVPMQTIMSLNSLTAKSILRPGQMLKMPYAGK